LGVGRPRAIGHFKNSQTNLIVNFLMNFFNFTHLRWSNLPNPVRLVPLFITLRTLSTKHKIFVYSNTGDSIQYSSFDQCSKELNISRTTIRKAIKENKPYKSYFFSVTPLELDYLQNLGFSITPRPLVNCTALVIWGSQNSLSSTVGFGRLSSRVCSMIQIPLYIEGIIIGLLLSDAWAQLASATHKNARLGFKQGMINFPYFTAKGGVYFVFYLLIVLITLI